MCRGQNIVFFLIEGDGHTPINRVFYIPIVMIPKIGWMTIAHIPCFDDGTYHQGKVTSDLNRRFFELSAENAEDSGNHPRPKMAELCPDSWNMARPGCD